MIDRRDVSLQLGDSVVDVNVEQRLVHNSTYFLGSGDGVSFVIKDGDTPLMLVKEGDFSETADDILAQLR